MIGRICRVNNIYSGFGDKYVVVERASMVRRGRWLCRLLGQGEEIRDSVWFMDFELTPIIAVNRKP